MFSVLGLGWQIQPTQLWFTRNQHAGRLVRERAGLDRISNEAGDMESELYRSDVYWLSGAFGTRSVDRMFG
jgi:hypothetical protein